MHTYTNGRIADYNPANIRLRGYSLQNDDEEDYFAREEDITADDDLITEDDLPFPYVE